MFGSLVFFWNVILHPILSTKLSLNKLCVGNGISIVSYYVYVRNISLFACLFLFLSLSVSLSVLPLCMYVLVSLSCPKALYHLESDNLSRIILVVADWHD